MDNADLTLVSPLWLSQFRKAHARPPRTFVRICQSAFLLVKAMPRGGKAVFVIYEFLIFYHFYKGKSLTTCIRISLLKKDLVSQTSCLLKYYRLPNQWQIEEGAWAPTLFLGQTVARQEKKYFRRRAPLLS